VTANRTTVLVVEDEESFVEALLVGLQREGFDVRVARDGAEALELFDLVQPDIVLLDLMLPKVSGIDVCRHLRARSAVPIIMVTARSSEIDTVVGLEVGADDYVSKPCNPRELLARVRAVLRRTDARPSDVATVAGCEFAGWRLDLVKRELRSSQGVVVNLSSGEFGLLRALVEHPQRVLTRDQLLELARGPESEAFDRAIDVQISRLRRKLDDGGGQDLIRTVRNEGYMFTPKVKRL
jgi:two-component system OmpR family response regulator